MLHAISKHIWVLWGGEPSKFMACIPGVTASSLSNSAVVPKHLSSLSSPWQARGLGGGSKREVSEAVGSPWEKRLGTEITDAGDNDAGASRLFCAAPSTRHWMNALKCVCAPCRTTKRSPWTRSPHVDRDQRPKMDGWWRWNGACGGCLNGWDMDWIKWQYICNGNK